MNARMNFWLTRSSLSVTNAAVHCIVLVCCLLGPALYANSVYAAEGSVSVFVLRDGQPVEDTELEVKEDVFYTDEDGFGRLFLPVGQHVIQAYISDGTSNLAFVKQPFAIVDGSDTRIIVRLNAVNEVVGLDLAEPALSTADASAENQEGASENTEENAQGNSQSNVPGTGALTGTVTSADTGSPIAGARIFLQGATAEETTDSSGKFTIALPADTPSTISVVHADHSAETLNELTVVADGTITRNIELQPAGTEFEEFIVLAPNIEGEIESIIEEQRNASAVAEVLGSEQFSKQGDSDAASALSRSTGLTLLDGRFVFVRGLGERYSTSQLNGLVLPSPEPTKRVVPLDMFPTSVVESIRVQKGWSADLPANFGGGNIDIRTRAAPDEFFAKLGISTKLTSDATFSSVQNSRTVGDDRFGFDNTRELSSDTKRRVDVDQRIPLTESLEVAQDLLKTPQGFQETTALPGIGLSVAYGDAKFTNPAIPEKRRKLAWFGAYGYSQDTATSEKTDRVATFINASETDDAIQPELFAIGNPQQSDTTNFSYEHGGLFGLSYDVGLLHKYSFNGFFTNLANSTFTEAKFRRNRGNWTRFTNAWMERSLLVAQAEGQSILPEVNNAEVSWSVQTSRAEANEPSSPSYQFSQDDGETDLDLVNRKVDYQNNELSDRLFQLRADITYPFKLFSDSFSSASAGLVISRKDRDARSRRFSVIFNGNPSFSANELPTAIDSLTDEVNRVNLTARPTESYTAGHNIEALYGKVNLFATEVLEVEFGLRLENSTQTATSRETDAETITLNSDKILPQFNLTYQVNETMQVRGGLAQTVTRPDFREFSTSRFQDPETADITIGNPFLTFSELTHLDLRFEWYLTDTDNITFGGFYKDIKNPIETISWLNDSSLNYSYLNADDADLYGIEVGWFRHIGHYSNKLRNWSVSGNLALTDSSIGIPDDLSGRIRPTLISTIGDQLTSKERAMQGQSPFVLNFTATYESRNITASAVLNQIGKRIIALGTNPDPDLVEKPTPQLDFIYEYKFDNGLKFSGKLTNALDRSVTWRRNGAVVREFKKGRSLGLGLKYDF